MKIKYKILLILFLIEYISLSVLNKGEVKLQSWWGNAIGTLLLCIPILVLLYWVSKDDEISNTCRSVPKIIFRFMIFCYFAGAIATRLELLGMI